MTDLVFSAATVEEAFMDAVAVLGVDGRELAYVVLDQPEPESGRPARIAVITHSRQARGGEVVAPPEENPSAWADLASSFERELGVAVSRDDEGGEIVVRLEAQPGAAALELEVLEAIAHLVERVAARESGGCRVVVKSEMLRRLREEYLCGLARELADEVRQDGEPRVVPCRNSFERRLVHVTLAAERGVRTASEGEGPRRQLVIFRSAPPEGSGADDSCV